MSSSENKSQKEQVAEAAERILHSLIAANDTGKSARTLADEAWAAALDLHERGQPQSEEDQDFDAWVMYRDSKAVGPILSEAEANFMVADYRRKFPAYTWSLLRVKLLKDED